MTRGILYASTGTDNEMMAYAAAQSSKWRIPSDIHKYGAGKTRMKDMAIVLLALMQRILRDKKTDFPYTVLTGFAVSGSAFLIFLIGRDLFDPTTGLILSIFYIISFWPWQVSLYGGHANLANIFFLLAVLAGLKSTDNYLLLPLSGVFLCCALFSSASSTKLIVPFWLTIFFNQYRGFFESGNCETLLNFLNLSRISNLILIFLMVFSLGLIILLFTYKYFVELLYKNRMPGSLNKIITNRTNLTLEYYQDHALRKIKQFAKWTFWLVMAGIILFSLIPIRVSAPIFMGFFLYLLFLNFPDVKKGIAGWFEYFLLPQRKTHFSAFVDYFAKRGITVQRNTRGAGISWIPKLLWTFAPFHLGIFVFSLALGIYKSHGDLSETVFLIIIALISASPVIWAELTNAPQIPRSYSSVLITGLLLPAYVFSNMGWDKYELIIFSSVIIFAFSWNSWKFMSDVYPGRMTVRNFLKIVKEKGINDIYTYQTSRNSFFVYAIPGVGKSEYLPEQNIKPLLNVRYIKNLNEVQDGWIAIPGTSTMEIDSKGDIISDDYTQDPVLNKLLDTKQLEKIAIKFKTYFTSTIWVNEDDVASYCALHLKDIGPKERYRGHAWLVHSSSIK